MKKIIGPAVCFVFTALIIGCIQSKEPDRGRTMTKINSLIGTWKFVSLEARSSKGEVIYPYGENLYGILTYNPDGRMYFLGMRPGRPKFASGDPFSGTPEEIKDAFLGFDAYCGTYDIDSQNGIVTHHIEGSKFPNWEGTDQTRYFELSADELILTAPPMTLRGEQWDLKAVLVPFKAAIEVNKSVSRTKVILLGTGTPNAEPDRSGSSVAIIVDEKPYLIDFGPGVVRQANAAVESGVGELAVANIKHVFATHLHSDHTAGYPDLILTPWVLERDEPLEVYGPKGIKDMTEHILAAYKQDIDIRLSGLEPANEHGWQVNVHEIEPGTIYKDSAVTVEAFPVRHGSWPAYGYKFITPDKTIVISGDTAPCESINKAAVGCDILIHEVYSKTKFETRPTVWKKYHSSVHTSSVELAELASTAKPGLLVLYHQLYWGASDDELMREIADRYDGEVVSGKDLDRF
jgi:ribonuclease BN (tRNA processing enzyme)